MRVQPREAEEVVLRPAQPVLLLDGDPRKLEQAVVGERAVRVREVQLAQRGGILVERGLVIIRANSRVDAGVDANAVPPDKLADPGLRDRGRRPARAPDGQLDVGQLFGNGHVLVDRVLVSLARGERRRAGNVEPHAGHVAEDVGAGRVDVRHCVRQVALREHEPRLEHHPFEPCGQLGVGRGAGRHRVLRRQRVS